MLLMSVAFRTMVHFDQQQITDILHSMHFKNLYRQRGLATLAAFIDEYPEAFDLNKQKLRFLIKVLNDDHSQYYQEITALIDNCFDRLKQIDHDEYEFLMRLLFLIGSYGSLTLWQIVNWIQFNYRGRDVFNKLNKRMLYVHLTILRELGLIKQIDFNYVPHYVHGVVNGKKTLIVNHRVKAYHAFILTNFGITMTRKYLDNFITNYQDDNDDNINTMLPRTHSLRYDTNLWKEQAIHCWEMFNWQYQLKTSGLANILTIPKFAVNVSFFGLVYYNFGWRSDNTFYTISTFFSNNYNEYLRQANFGIIGLPLFKAIYGTDLFMNQRRNEQKTLVSYEIPVKKLVLVPGTIDFNSIDDGFVDELGNYYLSDTWQAPRFYVASNQCPQIMNNNDHLFSHTKNADVVTNYQNKVQMLMRHFNDMSDLV